MSAARAHEVDNVMAACARGNGQHVAVAPVLNDVGTTITTTSTTATTQPSYIRPPVGHQPVPSVLQTGEDLPSFMNWRTRERQWELEELDREKQLELERERASRYAHSQKEKARREKEKTLKDIEASLYIDIPKTSSTATMDTAQPGKTTTTINNPIRKNGKAEQVRLWPISPLDGACRTELYSLPATPSFFC